MSSGITSNRNIFEDLSGAPLASTENPFNAILEACDNNPLQIQHRYKTHREARNSQYRARLLAPEFPGWVVDPILQKLMHPERYPGYVDPRHCLVFWARPPSHLRLLVDLVQKKLRDVNPDLWLMPLECLHMTALEVAHSLTESEIGEMLRIMEPMVTHITDYPFDHRARLIKPLLSYDNQAIALSFSPTSDEHMSDALDGNAYPYTYHHLRRDLYDLCKRSGVDVGSRYVVPSAHLTLARFVTERNPGGDGKGQVSGPAGIVKWINQLEKINSWLKEQYWPESRSGTAAEGEWTVGEEKGLECRAGTVWYGGGRSVQVGRGFTVSRLEHDEYRVHGSPPHV